MNRDTVIRLAREAHMHHLTWDANYIEGTERFAALVAAAEQKQTEQIVEELSNKALHAQLQAVVAEREACAQLCEDLFMSDGNWCAKQIRARSTNEM